MGYWCIDKTINTKKKHTDAWKVCHNKGRVLCSFDAMRACDVIKAKSSGGCGAATDDANVMLWTSDDLTDAMFEVHFDMIKVYWGNSNYVWAAKDTAEFPFFCCGLALQ